MDAGNLRSVLELMGARQIRPSGEASLSIHCFFPSRHRGGIDRRASMIASIDPSGPTWLKCFTCGFNKPLAATVRMMSNQTPGGRLSDLADWVDQNDGKTRAGPMAFKERRRDYTKQAKELVGVRMPNRALAFLKEKGLHSRAIIDSMLLWEPTKGTIVFPHIVRRQGHTTVIGGQARFPREPKKGSSKYWHHWAYDARYHLYGEHLLSSWREKTILLVEGQLDTLHSWQEDVPAVGNLGKGWSKTKSKLLKKAGIRRVVTFFDSDVYDTPRSKEMVVDGTLKQIRAEGVEAVDYRGTQDPKHCTQEELLHALETPLFKGGAHGRKEVGGSHRSQRQDEGTTRPQEHAAGAGHDGRRRPRRRKPRKFRP
jgi:hypothetical protein